MTLTTPLYCTHLQQGCSGAGDRKTFILISRVIRFILLFAYTTLPMWGTWVISQMGYREIMPDDMLLAMGWLPISAAIITLSFMKFGWKNKFKGTCSFIIYNAIALTSMIYFIGI